MTNATTQTRLSREDSLHRAIVTDLETAREAGEMNYARTVAALPAFLRSLELDDSETAVRHLRRASGEAV